MTRRAQGLAIILGSIIATIAVLAAALPWGPHHCELTFPMVIGCAIGSYETLAGGMIAAATALFAGWLAWSGVQSQIEAEAKKLAADRAEVEEVLQGDIDILAQGLATIWKILDSRSSEKTLPKGRVEGGVIWGIEQISRGTWIDTARRMITLLSWKRRRLYEDLFTELERLRKRAQGKFERSYLQILLGHLRNSLVVLRPEAEKYFEGLVNPVKRKRSLAQHISNRVGLFGAKPGAHDGAAEDGAHT